MYLLVQISEKTKASPRQFNNANPQMSPMQTGDKIRMGDDVVKSIPVVGDVIKGAESIGSGIRDSFDNSPAVQQKVFEALPPLFGSGR